MPVRSFFRPRPTTRPPQSWSYSIRLHGFPTLRPAQSTPFHSTAPKFSNSTPDHYETLKLSPNASAADIKRQFYALSKEHHPDRNPDDPTASTRFVAVSEAYHVLSVPEKRAQYDERIQPSQTRGSMWRKDNGNQPQGSYSSASFGSRPASGLNKKRSTFRGPPPSFYKAGGYGRHGAKRAQYADHHSDLHDAEEGGLGPGQQRQSNRVPHFDDKRHKETHDNVNEHINARRRRVERAIRVEEKYEKGDMLINFLLVSGVVGLIGATAVILGDMRNQYPRKRKERA